MADHFEKIEPIHREFILRQKVFFNASAAAEGRVNVSPRDVASLRVLSDNRVAYLDLTGSGNETAAHLRANGRLTLMFCSYEGAPLILRLYGQGRILRRGSDEYRQLLAVEFDGYEPPGSRQIVQLQVERVQTSCGYNVPQFDYRQNRDALRRWSEAKGPEGLEQYRREKNALSIDGLPTGMFDEEEPLR